MRFEKATTQKKRQRSNDEFKTGLKKYMDEHQEGKCEISKIEKRRCVKDAVKELDGWQFCNSHWCYMADKKLRDRRN